MATGTANFPNRPFRLRIEVWYNWQSGSTASVHVELWVDKLSYSPTQSSCCTSFEVYVDGAGRVAQYSGGFNFVNGTNFLLHSSDHIVGVSIYGDVGAQAYANFDILGYTQTAATHDGIPPTTPPAPVMENPDQVTTTGMRIRFNGQGDGGSPITAWEFQYATNASFSGATTVSSPGTTVLTGLTPGTTYYFRARGANAMGWGAWSNVVSQSTLPATPPGMSIAPSLNGQSSLVTLTSPGGVSGVTEYNIEFRPSGGSTTAYAQPGTTRTFTGLTPGAVYEYRANAEIGTYTSPWTAWTPVSQPNPNTNPGNYFDGSTADTTDLDYLWVGTANNSKSHATAFGVDGWDAAFATTTGVVYMVTGGTVSAKAARVAFTRDATAAGQWHAGQQLAADAWAEVAAGSEYTFSIYVNPSRSTRMAVRAIFSTGSSEVGGTLIGTAVVVPANQWTRLSYTVTAPADATRAVVRATDVAGTGFSLMLGGDAVMLDGAMISLGSELLPYFDGASDDSQQYTYAWLGTPFFSDSSRTINTTVAVDPLQDPDCPPLPAPPLPPIILQDCIEEVGSWRRYIVQISSLDVPLWGAVLPTLTLTTISSAERQVRIRYYQNPEGVAPSLLDLSDWEAEMILTYIPPNSELILDGVLQRVWVDKGMTGTMLAGDQLLFGTGGVPATWPELDCGMGYVISLDVPLDSPSGNLDTAVSLTQRI